MILSIIIKAQSYFRRSIGFFSISTCRGVKPCTARTKIQNYFVLRMFFAVFFDIMLTKYRHNVRNFKQPQVE